MVAIGASVNKDYFLFTYTCCGRHIGLMEIVHGTTSRRLAKTQSVMCIYIAKTSFYVRAKSNPDEFLAGRISGGNTETCVCIDYK